MGREQLEQMLELGNAAPREESGFPSLFVEGLIAKQMVIVL